MVQRQKPFGTLASRTIGDIYGEIEEGGTYEGEEWIGVAIRFAPAGAGRVELRSPCRWRLDERD